MATTQPIDPLPERHPICKACDRLLFDSISQYLGLGEDCRRRLGIKEPELLRPALALGKFRLAERLARPLRVTDLEAAA